MSSPEQIRQSQSNKIAYKPSHKNKREEERCFLCGILGQETPEGELTDDHIPPKNIFKKPRPSNLITARSCRECNHSYRQDEEYFRIAVCGSYNADAAGKELWNDKVVRMVKRTRRRADVQKIAESLRRIALIDRDGVHEAFEAEIESEPIKRVLKKMTKGFLSLQYPEIDCSLLEFTSSQLDPFQVNDPEFNKTRQSLEFFARGGSAFRCWFKVDNNYSLTGMWVYMFFGSTWFLVSHTSDRRIEVPPQMATNQIIEVQPTIIPARFALS
jgi:hypothetical protein